jgi:hypothetical protein
VNPVVREDILDYVTYGESVGIQITFPGLRAEVPFSRKTARALKADLAG